MLREASIKGRKVNSLSRGRRKSLFIGAARLSDPIMEARANKAKSSCHKVGDHRQTWEGGRNVVNEFPALRGKRGRGRFINSQTARGNCKQV
jgi:hypothetical protein